MKSFLAAALSGFLLAAAAMAQNPSGVRQSGRTPVILELFTSEGCSSCPPADRLLESLDKKQPFTGADLIVLSEHVDYWNGLGWTDPYSSKAFTTRQRRYAEQLGLEGIYTPQLVIDGKDELVGSNAVEAKAGIEKAMQRTKVALSLSHLSREGKEVRLHVDSGQVTPELGPVTLFVAVAEDRVSSEVRNGENAGRSLSHVAVVRILKPVAMEERGGTLSKDVALSIPEGSLTGKVRVVAFLQTDQSHEIVGAMQGRL